MARKSTKIEKEQRILELVRLISTGHQDSWIRRFMATDWGVSERQGERYLKEARETIVADINKERSEVLAEMIATCKQVIKEATKAKQYNNVIGAVNALSRLGKLDA